MTDHLIGRGPVVAALLACVCMNAALVPAAKAQCTAEWLPGGSVPGIGSADAVQEGVVSATTIWDPDGAGGQDPVLVVGGTFSIAGEIFVNNIAVWNGASWSTLGDGFNTSVLSLAVYDGDLIAGGSFTSSGATMLGRIARWNGSAWVPLSDGSINDMNNGAVYTMTSYNNNLVVGGNFTRVNSATDNFKRIAQWNGSTWSPVSNTAVNGFNNGTVRALTVYNNNLVAAGTFTQVDSSSINFRRIAQWNGSSWSAVSSTSVNGINNGTVYALAVYGGNLIAGGSFDMVDSATANFANIAQWNGSTWDGLGGVANNGIDNGQVEAMAVHNGQLIVGGQLIKLQSTGGNGYGIVSWNGSAWTLLVTHMEFLSRITNLCVYNGELIAGGYFFDIRPATSKAYDIARWDGSKWNGLFDPGTSVTDGYIYSMETLANGSIGVAGEFTRLEGAASTYVASVNGDFASGSAIGTGLFENTYISSYSELGYLFSHSFGPRAIIQMPVGVGPFAGQLFAGGYDFAVTSGGSPFLVAQSDGAVWSPLSIPLAAINPGGLLSYRDEIHAFVAMPNGDLVIGGFFYLPGDTTPTQVARWNGSAWIPLMAEPVIGSSIPRVFSLALVPQTGELVVGGSFSDISAQSGTRHIVRWDGVSTSPDGTAAWKPLGQGTSLGSTDVRALHIMPDGLVIAGGTFSSVVNTIDDLPVTVETDGIAAWNPSTNIWSALGDGVKSTPTSSTRGIVRAMTLMADGRLAVGGEFGGASNSPSNTIAANNIAIWNPATMQWSSLGDGVSAPVLSLATAADGTLLVGGTFATAGGQLSAHLARWGCAASACPADFNGVNGVTVQDIFDFLTAWLAGNASADFNGVNGVTVQDIFDFLTAWLAGC